MKTAQKTKRIYLFEEGGKELKNLLGGKGANLAEMTKLGIPVPPGFTITTEICMQYYENGKKLPDGLMDEVKEHIKILEEKTGKKFGSIDNPLLVSVRSGARVSMPGMMDTILNLGLNDESVKGLAKNTNNERFAYDAYRRFIQMFGDVVFGAKGFEEALDHAKKEKGVKNDTDLDAEDLKKLVDVYKEIFKKEVGKEFPQDAFEQLQDAIEAVFSSWNTPRAIDYRRVNKIPDDWGTAVNVVAMVFGNMGNDSATGVAFTRDPSTGEKRFFGEYLINAQGEDVVAGIRTPAPINKSDKTSQDQVSLEESMPEIYKQLKEIAEKLEKHYKDMQDLEFTIEKGRLWLLQTRNAKRNPIAQIKVAVDMVEEGLITEKEALMRIDPNNINVLLHPIFDPKADRTLLAKGMPASPGAASGKIALDKETAVNMANAGEDVILVRIETSPEDFKGMAASRAIVTSRGGATSHAAVVARGMGKTCVVGAEALEISYKEKTVTVGNITLKEGDWISVDGSTGEIFVGNIPKMDSDIVDIIMGKKDASTSNMYKYWDKIMTWANKYRKMGVRTNADTPHDSDVARRFGAEGIGLCRTEHMFMQEERLKNVQKMILAETKEEREKYLEKLLPYQKEDFKGILKVMEGYPVIIRLLDPPLHEFLPKYDKLLTEVVQLRTKKELGHKVEGLEEKEELLKRVEQMQEANPMLGLRVCRLGIVYPEIYQMQVRAIFEAACELKKEGIDAQPEVMIPGVGHEEEIRINKELVKEIADEIIKKHKVDLHYKIGTMMELPRACVVADKIAKHAEFFSFGTNDLTQTTLGYSRDDAAATFIPKYLELGIWKTSPFERIDEEGVGQLMKMGIEKGKQTRKDLEVGICGEHGGEPHSVKFCYSLGLNYVSCSPYRVPIAILSAAQASIENE